MIDDIGHPITESICKATGEFMQDPGKGIHCWCNNEGKPVEDLINIDWDFCLKCLAFLIDGRVYVN